MTAEPQEFETRASDTAIPIPEAVAITAPQADEPSADSGAIEKKSSAHGAEIKTMPLRPPLPPKEPEAPTQLIAQKSTRIRQHGSSFFEVTLPSRRPLWGIKVGHGHSNQFAVAHVFIVFEKHVEHFADFAAANTTPGDTEIVIGASGLPEQTKLIIRIS